MKIGYLGAGTWGFCLASLLASKGYEVISWTRDAELAEKLNRSHEHPFLPGSKIKGKLFFTTDMAQVLSGIDLLVESVTSAGIRPVFEEVRKNQAPLCPIVITSKGIEQNSGLILSQVIMEILGQDARARIGTISGPSYASEVIKGLPTSVVASAYAYDVMMHICETFTTPSFRVYPNADMLGVAYGGALKNIIAIACGMADGLGLGYSTKASLITRGLHEMRKLAVAHHCKAETLYGLAGLGDLCVTCSALLSRNCRFGHLLAQGMTPQQAQEKIGMVVEGAYTTISALQLSKQSGIPMPITETVYEIIYNKMPPLKAVQSLMARAIKEEHL